MSLIVLNLFLALLELMSCFNVTTATSNNSTPALEKRRNSTELLTELYGLVNEYLLEMFGNFSEHQKGNNSKIMVRVGKMNLPNVGGGKSTGGKDGKKGGGLGKFMSKIKSGIKGFANSKKGQLIKTVIKNALKVVLKVALPWVEDLVDVGIDCANHYLLREIVKQVKPTMELINTVIYPYMEVLDIVEKQQEIDCRFLILDIFV